MPEASCEPASINPSCKLMNDESTPSSKPETGMLWNVGCTDVDDALSARQLPDGRIEVGVHIADVSYFVKKVIFVFDTGHPYRGSSVGSAVMHVHHRRNSV